MKISTGFWFEKYIVIKDIEGAIEEILIWAGYLMI